MTAVPLNARPQADALGQVRFTMAGADVNLARFRGDEEAAGRRRQQGRLHIVHLLIEKGAPNIHARIYSGETPGYVDQSRRR